MPILAAPLLVRRALMEEAGVLAALLGRAFPAERWDAATTECDLFCDETVRATLVVAAEGRLVATASLQVRPEVPECGWVRWVATELVRRREGLAWALVIRCARDAGANRLSRSSASNADRPVGGDPVVFAVAVRASCPASAGFGVNRLQD